VTHLRARHPSGGGHFFYTGMNGDKKPFIKTITVHHCSSVVNDLENS